MGELSCSALCLCVKPMPELLGPRRIAELGENKQAMWTVLRQHHLKARGEADASSGKSSGGVGGGESTNTSKPAHVDISVDATALNDRENALRAAEKSFANEVNAQNESIAMREATLAQKESAVEKVRRCHLSLFTFTIFLE